MRRLIDLGLPAATQITLEVGVFAAATALAGRLPPVALAAHQIAVNFAALTFMVPLGVASAGAVRVGQAVGRRDLAGAARAGWTALLFAVAFMSFAAAVFLLVPHLLIGAFTRRPGSPGGRRHAADSCCGLSAVRRHSGRRDRRAARARRYPHADALEPRRPLVRRAAARLRAVLRRRLRRRRAVVGAVERADHLRRGAAVGLVAGASTTASGLLPRSLRRTRWLITSETTRRTAGRTSAENPAQRAERRAAGRVAANAADSSETSDRAGGRGSDANGVPAFDESEGNSADGSTEGGADLVSRID